MKFLTAKISSIADFVLPKKTYDGSHPTDKGWISVVHVTPSPLVQNIAGLLLGEKVTPRALTKRVACGFHDISARFPKGEYMGLGGWTDDVQMMREGVYTDARCRFGRNVSVIEGLKSALAMRLLGLQPTPSHRQYFGMLITCDR